MSLIFLLSMTLFMTPPALNAGAKPIKVVTIRASSALPDWKGYTFGADNLIDGRVDTSWQPAKNDTLGVGQWVELDLGAPHVITSIQVAQGLQKVDPKLGDLYCRNNRLADGIFIFDDGAHANLFITPGAGPETKVDRFFRGDTSPGKEVPTVTRHVRLMVDSVQDPVDWKDLAISEIRVFGAPADVLLGDTDKFACNGPGAWPFRVAVSDFCATSKATRAKHDCGSLVDAYVDCLIYDDGSKAMPAYDAEEVASGKSLQTFKIRGITHRVEFTRVSDGKWAVAKHVRVDASNKAAAPVDETFITEDVTEENDCWEKLGKDRPNYQNSHHEDDADQNTED